MNLKEKANQAKKYVETKDQLIKLIDEFLIKYKEYENTYKNVFTEWVNKIVTEFTSIFKSEGFELSIEINEYREIRFLQIKPEADKKNIIIKPTIEKYYVDMFQIKSSESNNKNITIFNMQNLEDKNKEVKNAKFSIDEMKEFILEMKKQMKLLEDELEKAESTQMKSMAIPSGEYGFENKDASYGEFEKFNELIEKI